MKILFSTGSIYSNVPLGYSYLVFFVPRGQRPHFVHFNHHEILNAPNLKMSWWYSDSFWFWITEPLIRKCILPNEI